MTTNSDTSIDISVLEEIASAKHCEARHIFVHRNGAERPMGPCSHTPVAVYSYCRGERLVCVNFLTQHYSSPTGQGQGTCVCGKPQAECWKVTPL